MNNIRRHTPNEKFAVWFDPYDRVSGVFRVQSLFEDVYLDWA
ncbi:MAG: hypothetical protein WCI11_07485 [Candidatus Methylumidiphilus sp.]